MKKTIVGVDEVGRGSLVGPVFAAAVIFKGNVDKKKFKDSKELSKDELNKMLIRDNRLELYENCIQFLKTRIKLDQSGFTEDIFQH